MKKAFSILDLRFWIVSLAVAVSAHAQLTQEQAAALRALPAASGHPSDFTKAALWANDPQQSGTVSTPVISTNIVTRDDLTVKIETVLKSIAQTYGITAQDNFSGARDKFVAAYATNSGNTAASIVARDRILDDKAMFSLGYGLLQTLDVTAAASVTNITTNVVLSVPWREANGFTNNITGQMIREAMQ